MPICCCTSSTHRTQSAKRKLAWWNGCWAIWGREGFLAFACTINAICADFLRRLKRWPSARKQALEEAIDRALAHLWTQGELFIPYNRGDIDASIRQHGVVLHETYEALGTRMEVRLPRAQWNRLMKRLENDAT